MAFNIVGSNELLAFENITGVTPSQVEGDDIIEKVRYQLEKFDLDSAKQCLQQCADNRGVSAFILGGLLEKTRDNKWYKDYGYSSFKELVEQRVGISTSAAYDYMTIYRCLIDSGVSWSDIKHIGWTKIRWFAKHLTQTNVDDWIKEAETKNVEELKKFVKEESDKVATVAVQPKYDPAAMVEVSTQVDTSTSDSAEEAACPEKDVKPPLVTEASALDTAKLRQFKLYPEQEVTVNQALDHVKAELQTEHNGAALEGVCIAYLSGCI